MAQEAWQTSSKPEVRQFTPRRILLTILALNGAYALFLDDLFGGASEITAPYRREETFGLSQKLWKHWLECAKNLGPGDEYPLVDKFAEMVGPRDWYEWRPDPGHHEVIATPLKEGTTNPDLLTTKQPAFARKNMRVGSQGLCRSCSFHSRCPQRPGLSVPVRSNEIAPHRRRLVNRKHGQRGGIFVVARYETFCC